MAGNDRLIFPVEFDLENAVKNAQGNAAKALTALERFMQSRPINIPIKVDSSKADFTHYFDGLLKSGDAVSKRMDELIKKWDKLSAFDNGSGKMTNEAKAIVKEFLQLTAVSKTAGISLTEMARRLEQDTAAKEKAIAKSRQLVSMLKAEETSISAVAAKMKFYQDIADKANVGSPAFKYATEQLNRLGEKLQFFKTQLQGDSLNSGKDAFGLKQTLNTLLAAEPTLRQVKDAIKTLNAEMSKGTPGSDRWKAHADNVASLKQKEAELLAQQKEATKTESQLRAEREAAARAEMENQRKIKAQRAQSNAEIERERTARRSLIAQKRQEIAILHSTSKSLDAINAKLAIYQKRLNSQQIGSAEFRRTAEKIRQLTKELERYQREIDSLTGKKGQVNALSNEFRQQDTYLSRLIKRMVIYASAQQIFGFLTQIREVTAQFELQRVSLGAILQDQARANHLFSQIKTFAINSPVKILDLTKYTKQLAAYKIGYDELFETTKKLTDVSVGLGVSMDRVVLAYGQVRATGHLRASEIRQFTEMGVPIVEELAAKLSKMNGELVTAADVMDLVSKRGISFQMVKEVFDDMTSAGGIFYNMQEKQGETLYGMWAKLGDAASIMYEEIGNTGFVKGQMEGMIDTLTKLMRNWEATALTLASGLVIGGAVYGLRQTPKKGEAALEQRVIKATQNRERAQQRLNIAVKQGIAADEAYARAKLKAAEANEAKAIDAQNQASKTTKFAKGLGASLKSLASAGLWGAIIGGVTSLAYSLFESLFHANKLKNKLDDIKSDMADMIGQSTRNFDRLVNIITTEVDGTKKQKAAIDELNRTYGQMLSAEDLSIENLRRLKEGADGAADAYASLKNSISDYIVAQQKQTAIDEINSFYGADIKSGKKNLKDNFEDRGYSLGEYTAFFAEVENIVREGKALVMTEEELKANLDELGVKYRHLKGESLRQLYIASEALHRINIQDEKLAASLMSDTGKTRSDSWLKKTTDAMNELNKALRDNDEYFDNNSANLGSLSHVIADVNKKMQNMEYFQLDAEGNKHAIEDGSYLKSRMQANAQIKEWINAIATDPDVKREFEKAGVEIQQEWFSVLERIDLNDFGKISTIDFDAILESLKGKDVPMLRSLVQSIQSEYNNLVPKDPTVREFQEKFKQIVTSFGLSMDDMHRFMWNGSNDIKEYIKTLESQLDIYRKQQKKLQATLLNDSLIGNILQGAMGGSIREKLELLDKQIETLTQMDEFAQAYVPDDNKSKGAKSDPRLQNLQEIANKMAEVNKEYDELLKKEGQTKALADTQKLFASSFKQMQETAKKYKFKLPTFEVPQTIEDVQKWYKAIADEIKRLDLENADKVLIELGFKSDKAAIDKAQKDIEKQLKQLADRISRTKTAKEFYEKILKSTRDVNLAENMTLSVFGIDGSGLAKQTADQIRTLAEGIGKEVPKGIINLDEAINPTKLREWADKLAKIEGATEVAEKLKKIADDEEKVDQKRHDLWAKDLERAKEYADKRIELAQYTADQIAEIEAKKNMLDPSDANYKAQMAAYDEMIRGYRVREKNEAAKLDYEQVKEQIGMFDDLGVRIGSAFEQILADLKVYTQSPDFARLGLEVQKNVYSQIAKIEDKMAEGFQGIGIGTVSEYVREYSTAASEYLTAQRQLKEATLAAIDADKKYEEAKKSGNQATIDAALAEKQLADSRVVSATAAVNTAGANLQRTQSNAARASEKFNSNLQKVESSLQSLNNGALRALWDLIGDKGKRSVGEFLSGSYKMVDAIEKLTKALADSGSDMGKLSKSIVDNLATALSGINPEDSEAIAKAATESLKQTLSSVINDKGVVELLSNTLSKNIGEIASQALSGVLSTEDAVNKVGALIDGIADAASATGEMWGAIISLVLSLLDEFAENGIGTFLGELLDNIGEAVEGILANLLTESLPKIIGSVGNVVKGVGVGLADMLTLGAFDLTGQKRVKRANKEIERQQELLDQLEYTYGRLEKAAEKAFGGDYISNFKAQQKNLQTQAAAYQKQAAAERSKGKKADEDKIKEYEEKYRDTMDEIADMQGQIAAQMLGTDLTSAARDFAKAWLDAYKEFGNTAGAMSDKFHEMIENMVVEGALAKVMERALEPMFTMIDEMGDQDFYSESFWREVAAKAEQGAKDADYGAQTMMKFLGQAGISMRDLGGDLTGISRDIASASEESINGLAAGINTQNFYISQIHTDVAQILARMGGDANITAMSADYTPLIQQSLENQGQMIRYQAETLAECQNIAKKCQQQTDIISRVIVNPGQSRASASIQVKNI